jgi:hypothetical protein
MKDMVLLAVSVYLLEEDVMRWQHEQVFDLRSSTYLLKACISQAFSLDYHLDRRKLLDPVGRC